MFTFFRKKQNSRLYFSELDHGSWCIKFMHVGNSKSSGLSKSEWGCQAIFFFNACVSNLNLVHLQISGPD